MPVKMEVADEAAQNRKPRLGGPWSIIRRMVKDVLRDVLVAQLVEPDAPATKTLEQETTHMK